MENRNNINDDELIRKMMQTTKKEAPENLKYRIMHQIETENALSQQKKESVSPARNPLRSFWTVFGIMYAVIAIIGGYTYFTKGEEYLLSPHFIGVILLISAIFSLFWMMTKVDERLQQKRNNKTQ